MLKYSVAIINTFFITSLLLIYQITQAETCWHKKYCASTKNMPEEVVATSWSLRPHKMLFNFSRKLKMF